MESRVVFLKSLSDSGPAMSAWKRGETDSAGYTWGYQPRSQFPLGRLDKILYTPLEMLEVEEPRRIGVGLRTEEGQWASDHFGLTTVVRVV